MDGGHEHLIYSHHYIELMCNVNWVEEFALQGNRRRKFSEFSSLHHQSLLHAVISLLSKDHKGETTQGMPQLEAQQSNTNNLLGLCHRFLIFC